jgi:hypothetical protein
MNQRGNIQMSHRRLKPITLTAIATVLLMSGAISACAPAPSENASRTASTSVELTQPILCER